MSKKHKVGELLAESLPLEARRERLGEALSLLPEAVEFAEGAGAFRTADAVKTAISCLNALQVEGIATPEEVKDLIFDYQAQGRQIQTMTEKYEVPAEPLEVGTRLLCPACKKGLYIGARYCGQCGKRVRL